MLKKIIMLFLFFFSLYSASAQFVDWSAAENAKWADGTKKYSNPKNIEPVLIERIMLLAVQTNSIVIVNAGYRSSAEQKQIGDEEIQLNKGWRRRSITDLTVVDANNNVKVAAPGGDFSFHEKGNAVDIVKNKQMSYYTLSELKSAGLTNDPYVTKVNGEPWHVIPDPEYIKSNIKNTPFIFDSMTGTITGYTGPGGAVIIPALINGYPVKIIGESAFNGFDIVKWKPKSNQLTNVVIPNSVEKIFMYAFANNLLTSIIIPDCVKEIGSSAFAGNKLTSVTIGSNVKLWGYYNEDSVGTGFSGVYEEFGMQEGTYIRPNAESTNWVQGR